MTISEIATTPYFSDIKTTGYITAAILFQYLDIPTEQLAILSVLMIIDFITWVVKQYRVNPQEIKSHLAWLGVMKKVATLMSVLSVALVLKWLEIWEWRYITSMLWIFIVSEWYSTLQNIYAIRTGKMLPEFDVISIVIKNAWEFFKQKIENMVKKNNQ